MAIASAPGKIHLIGEHAVVYGQPAIIAAVGRRLFVRAEKSPGVSYLDRRWDAAPQEWSISEVADATAETERLWSECSDQKDFSGLFQFVKKDRYAGYRKAMVGIALRELGISEGAAVEIWGDVPPGAGMGSSSSLAVALAKAVATEFGKHVSNDDVNGIAYKMEQLIHGNPSGGDNTACCYGGLIWFEKGSPNRIVSLKEEVPSPLENFILLNTGTPEKTTGELVQAVRELDPIVRDPAMKEIGEGTHAMLAALKRRDFAKVQDLITMAQRNLRRIGVSTPEIDRVARAVIGIGGAAKLCGAGGGGMMLCYHKDRQKLGETIRQLGFQPIEADLGVEGVRTET